MPCTVDSGESAGESVAQVECDPCSEDLLELARTQWKIGDWESLVKLDLNFLIHHPDRAFLALLASAGHVQQGNIQAALQFIRLSQDWGCSKKVVFQILVAGVHNSLGRAAFIDGRPQWALYHFENAIAFGVPDGGIDLLSKARQSIQCHQIEAARKSIITDNYCHNDDHISHGSHLQDADPGFESCQLHACRFSSDTTANINGRVVVSKSVMSNRHERCVFVRPDSKGDMGVIKQIFEENQYEFGWIPQGRKFTELLTDIANQGGTPAIIDAGANIGASCVWFADRYPGTTILAIEPEPHNCELLRNNCAGHPVYLYEGGLADCRRILHLQDTGESDWGFRVGREGMIPVQCIGPRDILFECRVRELTPVAFKIDIEGGEDLVFSGDCSWIKKVAVIVIELHDWLLPGRSTSLNFLKAIADNKFQVFTRGENLFCFNPELLST